MNIRLTAFVGSTTISLLVLSFVYFRNNKSTISIEDRNAQQEPIKNNSHQTGSPEPKIVDFEVPETDVTEPEVEDSAGFGNMGVLGINLPPGKFGKAMGAGRRKMQQEVEQGGADQPATRPESKPEGSDKPQPESEGRSR